MPEFTLTITVEDEDTSAEELKETMKALQDLETEHLVNIKNADLKWEHADWDWDSPCPVCGSEQFHVGEIDYSIYQLVSGELEYQRKDNRGAPEIISVMCDDPTCMTQLFRGPASLIRD